MTRSFSSVAVVSIGLFCYFLPTVFFVGPLLATQKLPRYLCIKSFSDAHLARMGNASMETKTSNDDTEHIGKTLHAADAVGNGGRVNEGSAIGEMQARHAASADGKSRRKASGERDAASTLP